MCAPLPGSICTRKGSVANAAERSVSEYRDRRRSGAVLPGLAGTSIYRVSELTPAALAPATNSPSQQTYRPGVGLTLTVFRVNLYDLPPKTTYYYAVESMDSRGRSDGVKSPIKPFTTR